MRYSARIESVANARCHRKFCRPVILSLYFNAATAFPIIESIVMESIVMESIVIESIVIESIVIESVVIESVDSISRDERDVPLTQYNTNA